MTAIIGIGLAIAVLVSLSAWALMALFNWIVPIFWVTAPHLTFWQALGVMILLSIIGSFFRK